MDTCCGEMIAFSGGEPVCFCTVDLFSPLNIQEHFVASVNLGGSNTFLLVIHFSGVVSKENTIEALYRMTEWI
jgi:hypothetical protein